MDSIPMVAITGQVGSVFIGTDAFQEADIVGMTMPVTKHNFLVSKADEIPKVIKQAFHIASINNSILLGCNVLSLTATLSYPRL